MTARTENSHGLRCRCAGTHLKVVYTRARTGGKLVRRRECRDCGERVTTWERAIGAPNS
jgi:transcriptional regulator NrdR family protein